MTNDEIQDIKDSALCAYCKKPNLIWQEWRSRFHCGWCGKEYSPKMANVLKRGKKEKKLVPGIAQDERSQTDPQQTA